MIYEEPKYVKAAIIGWYRSGADLEWISAVTSIGVFEVQKIIDKHLKKQSNEYSQHR